MAAHRQRSRSKGAFGLSILLGLFKFAVASDESAIRAAAA